MDPACGCEGECECVVNRKYEIDFKTIDQVPIKMNRIRIKKLIPLVYRFESYRSYILSIGSFDTMCGFLGSSPLHSVAGTVSCDPIV
jgi:hypothetical protein